MSKVSRVSRHGLVTLLVVLGGCSQSELARAQDQRGITGEVEEQLGEIPATVDTLTAATLSQTFRSAASRTLPAVVFIRVERQGRAQAQQAPDFFRFFFPDAPQQQPQQMPPQVGQGSGFIIDEDGYVLTNNHVVENADLVVVQLVDGREYTAQVLGTDPQTDVAVLKITPADGEALPVAPLGDSDELRVGDWVLALGSPFGLQFTVTAGIVSAKTRSVGILQQQAGAAALESFIQTDAAINPGNSGGPMTNLLGQVVGITTAILSPTRAYAGYGFAIPINLAMRVARDLIEHGVVRRPLLGVNIETVDAIDAEVYGLPEVSGVEVISVQQGGPAARAGMQPGDVIVAIDGERVANVPELQTMVARQEPGEVVTVTFIRRGERHRARVELGEFQQQAAVERDRGPAATPDQLLGFQVTPLTPSLARQLGVAVREGVVIAAISQYGPAARSGVLRRGQVLLEINGREIRTIADVERAAQALEPGDAVALRVLDPNPDVGEIVVNYRARR